MLGHLETALGVTHQCDAAFSSAIESEIVESELVTDASFLEAADALDADMAGQMRGKDGDEELL